MFPRLAGTALLAAALLGQAPKQAPKTAPKTAPKQTVKQTTISGTVLRSDTKVTYADARMSLKLAAETSKDEAGIEVKTDAQGRFRYSDVAPGKYLLSASVRMESASDAPCRGGFLRRNPDGWLVTTGRTADGGVVVIVLSEEFEVASGAALIKDFNLWCR